MAGLNPGSIAFSPKSSTATMSEDQATKHTSYYFNDGSIVLRVENVLFKVHSSILGRHSEVFRGMDELPQPEDCEKVDGCPVVDLQDDVEEFTDTLGAIYDPFHFDALDPKSSLNTLLNALSGVLRISTKYNMDQLRKKSIRLLEAKFPSTLDGCIALLKSQFRYDSKDIVRIITLAGSTNVPSVLPWAYYLCTHMSVDDILKNPVLTWEDKALCLAGKEKLWQALMKHSHSFLFRFTPSPSCNGNCANKMSMMLASGQSSSFSNNINNPYSLQAIAPSSASGTSSGSTTGKFCLTWRDAEELRTSPHPLEEYSDWEASWRHVCSRCSAHLRTMHQEGRERVWKELPTYFNLGSWDEIHREQTS